MIDAGTAAACSRMHINMTMLWGGPDNSTHQDV